MQHVSDLYVWIRKGFSPGTLLTVLTIAGSFAVAHGKDQQRMDELERRLTAQETSSVKRDEFAGMIAAINDKLRSIDGNMQVVVRTLMESKR